MYFKYSKKNSCSRTLWRLKNAKEVSIFILKYQSDGATVESNVPKCFKTGLLLYTRPIYFGDFRDQAFYP